ncbi:MAG: gamma-glutamylcyclotransferase [Nitrospinae bacterium]|nr:gamma-glutamylcyclotransferase [Nitrospinota bacterium]
MRKEMGGVIKEFLFVYGTLRKETKTAMHDLFADCNYFSDGYMQGKLYEVNGYPGAIISEDKADKIKGEIYTITVPGQILSHLDTYEECSENFPQPHEYIRKKLTVSTIDGDTVQAWVYLYNRDVSGLTLIKSGDYLSYRKNLNE